MYVLSHVFDGLYVRRDQIGARGIDLEEQRQPELGTVGLAISAGRGRELTHL